MNMQPMNFKFKDDADSIVEDIISAVNYYNNNLDNLHVVGAMLSSFGQSVTVYITGIGYQGAKLVKFHGVLSDSALPVVLIQHVSQLNFLLVSLPILVPEEPKKTIGFIQ